VIKEIPRTMKKEAYRVIFKGELASEADPNQVKIGMAKLFTLNPARPDHLAKLRRMFSGRNIVIKDNLTKAEAEKYQQAISLVGGVSQIELTPEADQRKDQRRKQSERRAVRRTSSILPDRRKNTGRRQTDPHNE